MLITYLRSSSYGTYSVCPHKYFIRYVLGVEDKAHRKAILGTMVHKALEYLASKKLAVQEGKQNFYDDSLQRNVSIEEVTHNFAVETAFNLYNGDTSHNWSSEDLATVDKWFQKAISFNDGEFNPENLDIFKIEQFFDITFEEPWSEYRYEVGNETITGNLSIRGTCDLLIYKNRNPVVVEYLDWKTGSYKTDFATGKEKTHENMREDAQFMIYNYALRQLFPELEDVIFTIYFINAGGPISVIFYKDDTERCKELIKRRFLEIKEDVNPSWIFDSHENWKCTRVPCSYHSKKLSNGKSVCQYVRESLKTRSVDEVTAQHAKLAKLNTYEGGGNIIELEQVK